MCEVPKVVREQFVPIIQDIGQNDDTHRQAIEKYKRIFEARGWFLKDHFELIRDELTVGHGSGPQRFGVELKMPEAAMFFLLANQRNREKATAEVERLLC